MKGFKLTKETDTRCIEYWEKAFPELDNSELEVRRVSWISKNIKKKK